jgi:steroid 5-alpha reductase family enzyme
MTLPLLSVLVFMLATMAAAWAVVVRTGNGGWTDVFWTWGAGISAAACALAPVAGPHSMHRQWLVAALVVVWAVRLGTYITVRVARGAEDVRYTRLRELWGAKFNPTMLGFLLLQAPITVLLCLSVRAAAARPVEALQTTDWLGLTILAVAIVGEALADRQMRAFKRDPANHGKVADTGLWAWSRHPNYFFEWFGWLAYPVIAIDLAGGYPAGWLAMVAPVVMYLLLTRITGVPALESAMVATKGDAYRDYQRRVSPFFPLPPKP